MSAASNPIFMLYIILYKIIKVNFQYSMKRKIFVILPCLFLYLVALSTENEEINKQIEFQTQKFKYILETAAKYHPDSLDIVKISDEAFASLLQAMDKESFYYDKSMLKRVQESHAGVSYGIGIETISIDDTIFVFQVFENTPADSAGIEIGDVILEVDGIPASGKTKSEIDELISGDDGTEVNILIKSINSNNELNYKVIRKDILMPGLTTAYMFPKTNIGIFVINRFSENTSSEFKSKAQSMLQSGMKRVIIDVRNNPGGYMTVVDEILDYFINGEKLLTKAVSGSPDFSAEIYSNPGDFLEDMPIIVLVDENSASGSEILAGVVQDYDRGIVIGKRTYGKGTIQRIWNMNDTTGFKLTVGKYYTPSGRDVQKKNTDMDYELSGKLNSKVDLKEYKSKIDELGGFGKVELYKSESGRVIVGGGGVVPDVIVDKDTLTQLTNLLIRHGLFFRWSIMFKSKKGSEIKDIYGSDFRKFNEEFQITDELIREFAAYCLNKNLWNTDMYNQDKSYFLTYLKASIANVIWGYDAFSEILCVVDNQLVAAVLETPKAAAMIIE